MPNFRARREQLRKANVKLALYIFFIFLNLTFLNWNVGLFFLSFPMIFIGFSNAFVPSASCASFFPFSRFLLVVARFFQFVLVFVRFLLVCRQCFARCLLVFKKDFPFSRLRKRLQKSIPEASPEKLESQMTVSQNSQEKLRQN